jgi:hypothetical protein
LPLKALAMFQPFPCPSCNPPRIPPTGFSFEAAPAIGGPWIVVPGALQPSQDPTGCEYLSINHDGTHRFPLVDFTAGDCLGVIATVADTDTHLRATAVASGLNSEGAVVQYAAVSNVQALPEPNPLTSFLVLFLVLILLINGEGKPLHMGHSKKR